MPTNNPLNAVLKTAKDLGAQEVMLGASNKYTAEEQLDQICLVLDQPARAASRRA